MKYFILIISLLYTINCFSQNIKISAVGDIMAHDNLQYYALAKESKYETLFASTKDIFLSDDITIANLETPISDEIGVKNYPFFNAKSLLVEAIKKSGIEILSLANNHSFDQGELGITSTIEYVKKNQLIYSGIGLNPEEAKSVKIFIYKGVVFGFLSATFSVNGLAMSEKSDKPYAYLVPMENERLFKEFCDTIYKTKKIVDFMIVSYHSGTEYSNTPSKIQTNCLEQIAEAGADVVLGHHPHVLQKIEYFKTKDLRKVLIAYSLGNFISGQANYLHKLKKDY
ncbi:MAG TPA: CapA family protein, partial [Spirochaetota bacterium]|nr:CapA family protein [Spirochaetota bacterium]